MRIFPESHGLHREVCSASKSIILFAVLLMNMSGTLAQTCNSALDIYTLPSAGDRTQIYNHVFCPVFTAPVDGFLDYMTVLITGGLNNNGFGSLRGGAQYRDGVYIAAPSSGGMGLDTSYTTRTRAIELDFLQGDVMSSTQITTFVSFTHAYVQIYISCR